MKEIKTRESIGKDKPIGPSLAYRMRKGLLKGKEATSRQNDTEDPSVYAENQTEQTAENSADYAVHKVVFKRRTDRANKSQFVSDPDTSAQIIPSITQKTGAADTAAPSFEVSKANGDIRRSVTTQKRGRLLKNHNNQSKTITISDGFSRAAASSDVSAPAKRAFISKRAEKVSRKKFSKTAEKSSMAIGRVLTGAAKAVKEGVSNLVMLIAAGGSVSMIIIILICSIGLAVGSVFGIFFSGQNTGSGKTMQSLVQDLNEEYQEKLSNIKTSVEYDYLDLSGQSAIWREVLAVYAVRASSGSDAVEVASLDERRIELLKETFWAMNSFTTSTETITEKIENEEEDADGNIVVKTEEVERTVLKTIVSHKTAYEMAAEYGFDEDQYLNLAELLSEDNNALWAAVLYGLYDGDDYLMASAAASRVGNFSIEVYMKGPMIWPLDSKYHTITDSFGFRIHPIKKVGHNHTGTDIGAPEGASIYAVLPGNVVAAGESGDYGYRVIIDHGDGVSTLYAHASSILVFVGDIVEQGDVVALVGETGTATGPHLHIEVRINNVPQDAMSFLKLPK